MRKTLLAGAFLLNGLLAQQPQPPVQMDPQPIYRVTVVSRTLQAVNYEHRSGPTRIDFQGTILLPRAKGDAIVESKRGRIAIDARFDHIDPPTKFGREYLTYVLWAITPEGRPHNLGEVLVNGSDKAKLQVTTDLQALGLMVTAEPYYSVTTPSDVVVLENVVRPDTIGRVEPVTARYELMPRGQYTMVMDRTQLHTVGPDTEVLPYDRYEAVLELYQAQNAVAIAQSFGADRYAPETFDKSRALLARAQDLQARRQDTHMIVSAARESAQMAEDARSIAVKRRDRERLVGEARQAQEAGHARLSAESEANQIRAQAAADRAAADADRAEAERARAEAERDRSIAEQRALEAERARAPVITVQSRGPVIEAQPVPPKSAEARPQDRAQVLTQLNRVLSTRDTPRGLVATVPDSMFESGQGMLSPAAVNRVSGISPIVMGRAGLTVSVEGYVDDRGSRELSERRAQIVRETLISAGMNPDLIRAVGYGNERPLYSNAAAGGREGNRRVEIVISGPAIGGLPLWDRTYPLTTKH